MIAALDAEWTRRPNDPLSALNQSFESFRNACKNYQENIGRFEEKQGRTIEENEYYREILFSPQDWIPCGHSDALCLALIDDLDAVQTVIETYPKTVEEVAVAFCVNPEPLTKDLDKADKALFIEPANWVHPDSMEFREAAPLMHFARLKIQGILTLGRALLVQGEMYACIVERVVEAMNACAEARRSPIR